jgi:hypothetical protein
MDTSRWKEETGYLTPERQESLPNKIAYFIYKKQWVGTVDVKPSGALHLSLSIFNIFAPR